MLAGKLEKYLKLILTTQRLFTILNVVFWVERCAGRAPYEIWSTIRFFFILDRLSVRLASHTESNKLKLFYK